ncbi:hypothetical protein LguiA_021887 [Lonicera macranthoides]
MIQFSSSFYSTMVVHGILNDNPHMMNHKDRAWKCKRNCIGFHMLDSRSLNDNHTFNVVHKDWVWKFKRISMAKKRTVSSKDRVSELSIELIGYILERMSARDAARTSVLSKKWRYIWASHPQLVLGANEAIGVVNYMEAEGNSDLRLNWLQTVILHYFNGLKAEVLFTKLLLSYSPSLERMVIENRSEIDAKEGLRISTELMQFPRASTKVQISYLP